MSLVKTRVAQPDETPFSRDHAIDSRTVSIAGQSIFPARRSRRTVQYCTRLDWEGENTDLPIEWQLQAIV